MELVLVSESESASVSEPLQIQVGIGRQIFCQMNKSFKPDIAKDDKKAIQSNTNCPLANQCVGYIVDKFEQIEGGGGKTGMGSPSELV